MDESSNRNTMPTRINADLGVPARELSAELPWRPSPAPGVERRMLERRGAERARVTSLVRYAPDSRFPSHTHGGGEEFLVLDGTFHDEHGSYPAGWYVRNPVGSGHTPHTTEGCTILVKLWWMHPDDQEYVRFDTAERQRWRQRPESGLRTCPLHATDREENLLLELAPGATLPERGVPGGEELFLLRGAAEDADGSHPQGTWLRRPGPSTPALTTTDGCLLYCKRGHLREPPPLPPEEA